MNYCVCCPYGAAGKCFPFGCYFLIFCSCRCTILYSCHCTTVVLCAGWWIE